MTNLQEVPTEDLLSFRDYPEYPSVHNSNPTVLDSNNTTISISESEAKISNEKIGENSSKYYPDNIAGSQDSPATKSFWSIEYYQKFFDVDTKDVVERILASVTPKWDNKLKNHLLNKPDLYGPFWISITLIFTIAISGNIANYFQHANARYHWKYDFHLVSYAATAIFLYVTLIPAILWILLKWSSQLQSVEGLDERASLGALELICIYGYSLFIYIPVSILWCIQINFLQWSLVLLATFVSGSVLLLTLMPALRLSRHKLFLSLGILICHLSLAAGFMLYFFHVPSSSIVSYVNSIQTSTLAN